ncbi:MAG: cell division protein ZapA [Magnetospirillum sp.]|nr:cell division protein ZapA [Magnetospirillum sp.]
MAVVNLTINGRVHEIACDDSQVARVTELGREVDSRAQSLLKQIGNVPDARLLVMVGLMLADELAEAREQLRAASGDVAAAAMGDAQLAEGIEALAARIEGIADRLERA